MTDLLVMYFDYINKRTYTRVDIQPIKESEENRHWLTCTHRTDCDEIIKEAEQVAIFSTKDKKLVHISISYRASPTSLQWFSCKQMTADWYAQASMREVMELINSELRFLRTTAQE